MIGQGRIDNIISSKSDERRDIFEEAAGISKYRYRKLEAERKLTAAEDNLLRLHDISDELEARVGPLHEQSAKAQKFLELSDRKKELEIGLWIHTLDNSKEVLRAQESKIAAAQLAYREIDEELSSFDRRSEENTAYFARLTSDIEGERLNISRLNEEILKNDGAITVIKNDMEHNRQSFERLQAEAEQLGVSDAAAAEEIEKRQAAADEKKAQKAETEQKLAELEKHLSDLLTSSENISRKIENEVKRLNALTAESADKRVEMVTAESAAEETVARRENAGQQIAEYTEQLDKLTEEFNETQKLIQNIEEEIISRQNAVKGYELRLTSKKEAAEKIKAELEEKRLDAEEKRRRAKILRDLENSMEGFSHSVKEIVKQAETGTLRGICGPVSKLISVEKQYGVAVETALAAAIQNIIVETEADAKRAISYLKSTGGGRATFLPVATIKSREFKEHGFEDMAGFVGIASDLVETDNKYREIIKYLLGAVVVTEDIDSAAAIAKKFGYRIKVVSLDGQIVNPGGSLTGGSLTKNAGLINRAADIKALEEKAESLKQKTAELEEKLREAEESAAAVNADITAVRAEITTAYEDKIRALAELRRIGDLKTAADGAIKQLTAEKGGYDEKLKQLKETAAAAARAIAELDKQKNEVQASVADMTGGRDNLNADREESAEQITALKLNIIEMQKDIEAADNSVAALKDSVSGRAQRLKSISAETEQLNVANSTLEQKIQDTESATAALSEQIKQSENNINEMLEKRDQTEKAGVELRTGEREKTALREKTGGELARLTERREVMLREYDDVIKQLYDEYQLTRSEAEKIGVAIDKPAEAKKSLAEIKAKIRSLGSVNVSAIEEYKEVSERYEFMSAQINDVETTRAELHKLINQLTHQMQDIFTEGFGRINENFRKTFTELFGGGSASLTLSDPENVLESGIDINVKLPGKNVPSLDGLSGGEKALIALSIYFAIMRVNAPPFCFLDEVDTALDDINVDRFADYMKKSGFATQFICVTHRRGTMEAADMLYGVTMQEKGITKLIELNVAELEKTLLQNKGA